MYSNVLSASVCGLEATLVNVEADVGSGLPVFEMSGFLGIEVREAKERVRVAIKNSGIELKPQRIVINISPADIRKDGTGFDLPIALAILAANEYVNEKALKNVLILGELSLDGSIHGVKGILPCVYEGVKRGAFKCIVPYDNRKEAAIVEGGKILAVKNLSQVIDYLNGNIIIKEQLHGDSMQDTYYMEKNKKTEYTQDYSDIRGQYMAKRATMIAVAGMHNIIYVGTPGSGKTMMAKRIPTIMPELSYDESLQVTKIYSVAGILDKDTGLIKKRPFRSPHHGITAAALLGGGRIPKPGEVTLAGKGVLFLDELTEFNSCILESLRQTLEDKKITIVRLNTAYTYPADFMLAAAINPCKCGYYPDRHRCRCSEHDIRRYMGKISRPMWDRFDLCVYTETVRYIDIKENNPNKTEVQKITSESMRKCVEKARAVQEIRFKGRNIKFNSEMTHKDIEKYCVLDEKGEKILKEGYEKMQLTARGYYKILKTARTIADIEESKEITYEHVAEAVGYRRLQIE
ncbi:MAG: YifB family Mg chelatase-like AAA ATPase [Eubacteriales bacterium]|nr:YifB family Mg chelatase-like AAA ATPase [Eubacteriales bacterium]